MMNTDEKEKKLARILKNYPHPDHSNEDRKWLIVALLMSAHDNGWTDEFIRICENNPSIDFGGILKLLITDDRFPPLEIVDDEE